MTTKTRKFRPSPAIVISCLALFLALTGSAFAVGVGKNTVRSAQIVNGTIRTADLGKDAVKSPKIADATVSAADLGTDSVGSDEIAKDAVNSDEIAKDGVNTDEIAKDAVKADEIAANAVASSEVADQSLTQDDLGPNSVGSSELQTGSVRASELGTIIQVSNSTGIAANTTNGVSVQCPAGTTVISGGAQPGNFGVEMTSSLRSGNGWLYQAKNNNGAASTLTVHAYCLTGGSSN
jgi:trimeric autotransporter adhesin